MSNILKWFKRQAAAIAFATSNVEKNNLYDVGEDKNSVNQEETNKNHSLSYALKNGIVNQEVKDLRARMYMVMEASEGWYSKVTGYRIDEDGASVPITERFKVDENHIRNKLDKVNLDPSDEYKLELLVNNEFITSSVSDAMDSVNSPIILKDSEVNDYQVITGTTTIGGINSFDYMTDKGEKPIKVDRELRSKFEIEKYTHKLFVRTIDENKKLLEFHINKTYDDRTYKLLYAEIKRAIVNPRSSNMLEINAVGFITDKTLGSPNNRAYHYKIISFDKIVEFNGNYIIKFISEVVINGDNILEQYREKDLEEKYKNVAARKR